MPIRNYNVSDLEMLNSAKVFITNLSTDLADFTAFDTTLDAAFVTAFQSAIDGSETDIGMDALHGVLRSKTLAVDAKMQEAYVKARQVLYFVGKTWPGNAAKLKEFGAGKLSTVRRSPQGLLKRLRLMEAKATEYSAQLIAKGFVQTEIDEIATVRDELDGLNNEQEAYTQGLPRLTQERVLKHNVTYSYMQQLSELAKVVYTGDEASLTRYRLPQPGLAIQTITLPVGGAHVVHFENPLPDTRLWAMNNNDAGALRVCNVPNPTDRCSTAKLEIQAGEERTFMISELGTTVHPYVVFQNMHTTQPMTFKYRRVY